MSGRTYALVCSLALLAIVGIAGMLLGEGVWDVVFFAMAASPLVFGAWRRHRLRSGS